MREAAPVDGETVLSDLDAKGFARRPDLLDRDACRRLIAMYRDDHRFRSRIVMAHHGFGRGTYGYFRYPLPEIVSELRGTLYQELQPLANEWRRHLGLGGTDYPPSLEAFSEICRRAGQDRPTPLLLRYEAGDYNCLHQDVYGEVAFPFQVIVGLNAYGRDYDGGELVLVENRPRMQSIPHVIGLGEGDAVILAVRERPKRGRRGYHKVTLRHGVSEVTRGERYTLGIIFHDAA